ncbi:MAG: DNA polymerase III subunit gamma/tau, partial [Patescibacteria group bacterium]|nr:DNA polymerase III subunit gamma/tau [Patescibacteria group bacterium]
MSLALYRKYRPQTWAELTGQNHIKITLQHEIEGNKVAHAYLFTGPRGIGKTTAARLLARSVNCENRKEGQSEPCGKCSSCLEQVAGRDMDILEVDAASQTGVDNVRENIIANARFTPLKRKFKVFIIDEVHMLSISAFNALLKILEEPPAHAIFILCTTEIHKVPATIISRCQRFDFRKVNSDDLISRLDWICKQEGIAVERKVLLDIARVSEGCLRDAESLLGQVLALGDKKISAEEASLIIPSTNLSFVLDLTRSLVQKNTESAITLVNKLAQEGIDLVKFTDDLVEFLRKIMLAKISHGLKDFAFDLDAETEKQIIDLAASFGLNDLIHLINIFSGKKFEIKTAAIPQLPLEVAIIEFCGAGGDRPRQDIDREGPKNSPPSSSQNNFVEENKSGAKSATLKNTESAPKMKVLKNVSINIDEVRKKWHNFLVKLQDINASLVFVLKVAEPVDLKGNVLKIGFKYAFHQQRINQIKIKQTLEKALSEYFNEDIQIETSLLPKGQESNFIKEQTKNDEVEFVQVLPVEEKGQQQEMIDLLVNTLGGKIIE